MRRGVEGSVLGEEAGRSVEEEISQCVQCVFASASGVSCRFKSVRRTSPHVEIRSGRSQGVEAQRPEAVAKMIVFVNSMRWCRVAKRNSQIV